VPYQLHCWPLLAQALDATLEATLVEERLLEATDNELEERTELDETTLDDATLDLEEATLDLDEETTLDTTLDLDDEADETAPLQTAPVTTGVSTAPLVVTCRPKLAV